MISRKGTLQLLIVLFFSIFLSVDSFGRPIFTYTSQPIIRVSLKGNLRTLSLHVDGTFKLKYQDISINQVENARLSFDFSDDGTPEAHLPNQELKFFSPITIEPLHAAITASDSSDDGIRFSSQTYPGSMEIVPESDGTFRLLNIVPLETYLRGVVPNELVNHMTTNELQACMAQAIAARNFAFYRLTIRDSSQFDVYSDTRDQVYSGKEKYQPLADSAVELTSGMIVEYDGQPARCFFHSTCGGHTENVRNVWQGQPSLPYLRGVSDTDSATGEPFCIDSPQFYWTTTFTGHELNRLVKTNLAFTNPTYAGKDVTGDVSDLEILDRFSSFRVDTLAVRMDNGDVYYVRGDRTRYLFRSKDGTILRSSMFKVKTERNYGGRINEITISGRGNGHGVGMCQWGALGMSKLGYSYLQILSHYYPGTVVKKVY
ncbi:MAG: SpoIID/LytB domain-containing protein [Bacteroidetes bacterium]|nr:SpoIID/LytB domain-containing protein [Bacteroidota bacterium]MCL5267564.1 SpoIID/LytB domain-containing protein [Bacteroidota bacterium]